jgi:hypothetical protein
MVRNPTDEAVMQNTKTRPGRTRLTAIAMFGLVLATETAAQSVTLVGEDGTRKVLSAAELSQLPQRDVRVVERDSSVLVFRGPTLRALMTLVAAPAGHALRGPSMLLAVLAEAADGYRIAFMLAELDEQFGAREAILALTQNDGQLPARDGPFRIVVPGEVHRARWARQIETLRLTRVRP